MAAVETAGTGQPKTSVFLSYSRRDNLSFADQLTKGLETFGGVDVLLDRTSIAGGEVWTARTQHLIESCDTILLAISPEAVKSEICNWEIDLALKSKKRVFTVFNHDMADADVPERVRTINQIFFFEKAAVPGSGFATGLTQLVALLKTDVAWVRKHTEVAAAAKRWDDNGRREGDLWRGSQLEEALKWRAARPAANAPELTDLQAAFLNASDERQRFADNVDRRRNRRILAGVLGAALIVIGIGVVAVLQARRNAENLGILFAELSQQAFDKSDYTSAMRWALAGLDTGGGEVFGPDKDIAEFRLTEAHFFQPLRSNLSLSASLVAFFPDGRSIAVWNGGSEFSIVDVRLGMHKPLKIPISDPEFPAIEGIRVSPDGQALAIVRSEAVNPVEVWRIADGTLLFALDIRSNQANTARFSRDGKFIVTSHRDGTAKLWDGQTGRAVREFSQHFGGVRLFDGNDLFCAEFSPDGASIVTTGMDGTAKIWNAATGELQRTFQAQSAIRAAAYSSDGRLLVTGSVDGVAQIWDLETGRNLVGLKHSSQVMSAEFSADGQILMTYSDDRVARIWSVAAIKNKVPELNVAIEIDGNAADPRAVLAMPRDGGAVAVDAALSPDGRTVAMATVTGLRLWDARAWDAGRRLATNPVAISQDGRLLATMTQKSLVITDSVAGKLMRTIAHGHSAAVNAAVFSMDGKSILTASKDKTARLLDRTTGALIFELTGHENQIGSAAFSRDGRRIMTVSNSEIRIWFQGKAEFTFEPPGHVQAAALSPEGDQFAVSYTRDGKHAVEVWDVRGQKRISALGRAGEPDRGIMYVTVLEFSPSGDRIYAGSAISGWFTIWDLDTGAVLLQDRVEAGGVNDIGFSPDGQSIVAASDAWSATIWDVATGAVRLDLPHEMRVRRAMFTANGLEIVTVSDDAVTKFFDVSRIFGGTRKARIAAACSELRGLREESFTTRELARSILSSQKGNSFDPCRRKGLLSGAWWFGDSASAKP